MSSYLVHGIWLPVSGLGLWIEQVEGHKIVTANAVPPGTFPEVVERILQQKSFRNRARLTLRTPKGKDVSLMVPMGMFAPDETVVVLSQLAHLDGRTVGVSPQQRATLAPDLRWLIRAYQGLVNFVRAGRVTLRLNYQSGEWYPMWQLASGLGERGWLAEMVAAAPGILSINNHSLAEDLVDELTHWVTYMELKELQTAMRPYPWHEFVDNILHTTPVRRGRTQLLRGLNEWKDSITQVDLQLVFIVEEPPRDSTEAFWPIRVQVRSGTDSPQPVRPAQLDTSSLERLNLSRQRALELAPVLGEGIGQPEFPEELAGDWDIYLSTEQLVAFVGQGVAVLRKAGFAVLLPKAWAHMETKARLETRAVHDPAESATQARLGLDKLVEYDWKLSVGDIDLTDEEMAQLVESKSGLIQLRGEWVMADTAALSKISEYMEELAKSSRQRARRNQATVAELRELAMGALASESGEPIEFTGSEWFSSLLGGMNTIAPERVEIPATVHADLREYQRRGVDWLTWMSRNNIGAVLADDMGLGKTLQLLATIAVEKAAGGTASYGPTLVIAPTSVVGNWAREARKFVPSFQVLVQHGQHRLKAEEFRAQVAESDLVITSYGTVTRDFQLLGSIDWERVVLDEAQAIKNAATKASKAVRSLPARQRIALTGTPVENRLSEMRSILDFCNPGVLGSASFFRNHFAKAIERGENPEMAARLRQLIAPFILRRLKTDPAIIDDLPEKTEQLVTVAMTGEQAALYQALVNDVQRRLQEVEGMARRGLVLASLTRIKQICNHPAHYLGDGSPVTVQGKHRSGKVAELMRIIDAATESGERVLVFTQYRTFGDILRPYLAAQLGCDIPFLHGGVSKTKRDDMVENFQTAAGPPVMLLSLKAGGTGLNLTAANIVVHMDRWWNPAVENQATDRAFRIGQERNVQVYKMITAGTLEESIQDILAGKTELAGTVVGEGEGWLTELSPEQLAELMSYRQQEG